MGLFHFIRGINARIGETYSASEADVMISGEWVHKPSWVGKFFSRCIDRFRFCLIILFFWWIEHFSISSLFFVWIVPNYDRINRIWIIVDDFSDSFRWKRRKGIECCVWKWFFSPKQRVSSVFFRLFALVCITNRYYPVIILWPLYINQGSEIFFRWRI